MFALPLAFSVPMVLAALALLPALYYLLRITPPRPRQIHFPPLKLILDLQPKEETPARTPWWLLLLRLAIAAIVILAMAGPIWNPIPAGPGGTGPLLMLVDDGWAAAPTWEARIATAGERLLSASREGRPVAIAPFSEGGRDLLLTDGAKAMERLRALKPAAFTPDRMAAVSAVQHFLESNGKADILWISDGLSNGQSRPFAEALSKAAGDRNLQVIVQDRPAIALSGAENGAGALEVKAVRTSASGRATGVLRALDMRGLNVAETNFDFAGKRETTARFDLPVELRNEIARIEVADEHSAGAVTLLDERWKRRRVGVVTGGTTDTSQPLLSPAYYVLRALSPFADVREPRPGNGDPIVSMLDDKVSVMVLADVGVVTGPAHDRLAKFVEDGGVLLRFAGSRLAASADDLVPVRLRRGGRILGGSLSWDTPKKLAPIDRESPLFGFSVPDEVTVTRQVLAEPEAGLPAKTWVQLADGTPLITAQRSGKGWLILVHVTADTTWSNLPLSGMFVDVLRRIVSLSAEGRTADQAAAANGETQANRAETIAPMRTLDGFGVLGTPPLTAKPIPVNYSGVAMADHPPGFYGSADALTAVNTLAPGELLEPASFEGLRVEMESLRKAEPVDLRPAMVVAAFALLLADALASLWLSGALSRFVRRPVVASLLFLLVAMAALVPSDRAQAQTTPPAHTQQVPPALSPREMDAALRTRLAFVVTGEPRVDQASQVGLAALSRELAARTSLNPGEPMGLDPSRDDLAFYPFIYWPVVAERALPTPETITRIADYMKNGGTIVFDTRDALVARPNSTTPEQLWLRKLLANVDVPELEPVPRDHVITKTFYLIDTFIGRTTVGQTWIEALPPETGDKTSQPARAGDSVSPLIITSNDLAAAWAVTRSNEELFPLVPGGARQREMAMRGGINLVMYTLTGNYKADQVHVRDLLERLSH